LRDKAGGAHRLLSPSGILKPEYEKKWVAVNQSSFFRLLKRLEKTGLVGRQKSVAVCQRLVAANHQALVREHFSNTTPSVTRRAVKSSVRSVDDRRVLPTEASVHRRGYG
jgi:hypothetical protein